MALDLDLLNEFWKRTQKEKPYARYNSAMKQVRPFSLDDEVVEIVAEMASGEHRHKMMPIYRRMARLPFPYMWIEFDYEVLHRWRVKKGTTPDSDRELYGRPSRLGFLLDPLHSTDDGFRVTTIGMMPEAMNSDV